MSIHRTASFLPDPYLALLDDVRAKRHDLDAESLGLKMLNAILSHRLIIFVIFTSLSRRVRAALLTRKVGRWGEQARHSSGGDQGAGAGV